MKWILPSLLFLAGCREATPDPLTVEAYVWQSADKPVVRDAMSSAAGLVSLMHVRAAEMRWDGDRFVTQWHISELPAGGCGLVVRIGSSAAGLEWTPGRIAEVAAVFKKAAAFSPSEIQCDFDCPQKRLEGYAELLDGLQAATGRIPVLPTALPSWLEENEMRSLVRDRSGWVLQVHSLQLPSSPEEEPMIFNPAMARAAATKASGLGVPFRIAMATYGCEVRFNEQGKVLDVVSEDMTELTPNVWKRSFALADPVASALLVADWEKDRPEGLTGIIWYRLPVDGDMRNWPLETLRLVARGQVSKSPPALKATSGAGARDLSIMNYGKFPLRLPREIIVTSEVATGDGGGAYRMERAGKGVKFLLREDVWPWLDPGKKIASGWLRLSDGREWIDWRIAR